MIREVPGAKAQVATRIIFFVLGFALAGWAPLIPMVRSRLFLDEAQLGSLLLIMGIGSVLTMPFSGGLASRFGCRKVLTISATLMILAVPLMVISPNRAVLACGLFCAGVGMGTTDAVMNIQAVIVEKASGRAMMSGFHGLFSVGGLCGAGMMTGMLSLRWSPTLACGVITLMSVVLLAASLSGHLTYGSDERTPAFAFPKGHVLLIGVLCLLMFMSEGAVGDWSGVFLNSVRGMDKNVAGVGYVAFSAMMTIGRLTGDLFVHRFGAFKTLLVGSLVTCSGFICVALIPFWWMSVLGFALVGIGASNVVPVLFSAAGRQPEMPSNLAVASVSTLGYAGLLIGPGLIGYVARASSLSASFGLVALFALCIAILSRTVAGSWHQA